MRNPDEFDVFYKAARSRLLLQTYALTGDLPAARSAVRDGFVAAWHHWRKVSKLEDPEAWVRPHAWAHAQRRHTARIWHRDKTLDADAKATLDALGTLTFQQRKVLLLTQLAVTSMADMAREVGLTQEAAEKQLQTATAKFAVSREAPSSNMGGQFTALEANVADTRFPRPTIIRRAGATRRRAHTAAGIAATVATMLVAGTVVTQQGGVSPSLAEERLTGSPDPSLAAKPDGAPRLVPTEMLSPTQVKRLAAGREWRPTTTNDNTDGDGLNVTCQQERFADPKGAGALVRKFPTQTPQGRAPISAVQSSELSASKKAASAAFDTTVGWYAGCQAPGVQLISTHQVKGVGDEAMVLVLRQWTAPVATFSVGIARTGMITTSTVRRVDDARTADLAPVATLLSASVNALCGKPGSGACAGPPRLVDVPPLPTTGTPGMLDVVDLPPVAGVKQPWVGTKTKRATANVAATRCDKSDFSKAPFTTNFTRSFLIPQAKLPLEFGLTETVGNLPTEKRAKAFVSGVRKRMGACEDDDLTTEVDQVTTRSGKRVELTVWHLTTEISDKKTVRFDMGIVRSGRSVAQIGFVPADKVTISPSAFTDLVSRALDRLANRA